MMETLISLDKQLLLWFNGSEWEWLDQLVYILTNGLTWIPLYLLLFYFVVRRCKGNYRELILVLACAGLCVLLAGTFNDELVKPTVARLRPTHDEEIGHLVSIVNGYRGGRYGFFSSHAANTFSIALFFSLYFRNKVMTIVLIAYSLINCWTRMYLGVHYPIDITCGLLWGTIVGLTVYKFYTSTNKWIRNTYT